jgi:phosphoribosylformimino-5-aminoimidazole carboxamide ribotide isomerase
MLIFPAIDLKDQKVVRLQKGDFTSVTIYNNQPIVIAKSFEKAGARWLHIIDLDGAETGMKKNQKIIQQIKNETKLKIQTGGGIRNQETIEVLLNSGVDRVILGTMVTKNIQILPSLIQKYGNKIVVSVDSLKGKVTDQGWQNQTQYETIDFCKQLEEYGLKTIVYTDISKDGMMSGPNFEDYKEIKEQTNLDIIASGGVTTIDDVKKLHSMNLYGVIIGKALYEESISLKEAIACSLDE